MCPEGMRLLGTRERAGSGGHPWAECAASAGGRGEAAPGWDRWALCLLPPSAAIFLGSTGFGGSEWAEWLGIVAERPAVPG